MDSLPFILFYLLFQLEIFFVFCFSTPKGLEDVSKYPILFAELMGAGWTIEDLTKLAGSNFLRVLKEVEEIRDKMKIAKVEPYEDISRTDDTYNCTTS